MEAKVEKKSAWRDDKVQEWRDMIKYKNEEM